MCVYVCACVCACVCVCMRACVFVCVCVCVYGGGDGANLPGTQTCAEDLVSDEISQKSAL